MSILPLNQGGTGSDLSGTGGANEFVKQTSSGANLSVAALTTADVAGVGIVKNPTAAQTITGQGLTLSETAPLILAQVENVQIVDGTFSRGGTDIGNEINLAYAALPATGGSIWIAPQSNGAAYGFTTPIVFGASGKYVSLKGLAPSNQSGAAGSPGSMGGVTLNFTPTSGASALALTSAGNASSGATAYSGTITGGGSNAFVGQKFFVRGFSNYQNNGVFVCTASTTTTLTLANNNGISETKSATATQTVTAIELDWDHSGGDGFDCGGIIENITFVNNITSLTNGGSGSSAIGLDSTNGARVTTRNVRLAGFGCNFYQNTNSNSWGGTHYSLVASWGDINVQFGTSENFNWFGGAIVDGTNGVLFTNALGGSGGDYHFHGVSIDNNILPIRDAGGSNAGLDLLACHFECVSITGANHATAAEFLVTVPGGINRCNVIGGIMLDDVSSGAAPTSWVTTGSTCYLNVNGLTISAGNNFSD
jgi:hypothetical protein